MAEDISSKCFMKVSAAFLPEILSTTFAAAPLCLMMNLIARLAIWVMMLLSPYDDL